MKKEAEEDICPWQLFDEVVKERDTYKFLLIELVDKFHIMDWCATSAREEMFYKIRNQLKEFDGNFIG